MVFFNWATMQMAAKIVYYGPGLCGKTSNLSYIYAKTSPNSRGEMVSLETESDRTLFFDLLPIEVGTIGGFKTRLQLYTVPGQVFYNTTRKLVLKGVDGLVFVADSQRPMREANLESLGSLHENLVELGLEMADIPIVLQFNKRDLKQILTVEELLEDLNPNDDLPHFESSAINGDGVFETLKEITKLTLKKLRKRMAAPEVQAPPPRPLTPSVRAEPVATPRQPARISAAALARAAEEGVTGEEESVPAAPGADMPAVVTAEAPAADEVVFEPDAPEPATPPTEAVEPHHADAPAVAPAADAEPPSVATVAASPASDEAPEDELTADESLPDAIDGGEPDIEFIDPDAEVHEIGPDAEIEEVAVEAEVDEPPAPAGEPYEPETNGDLRVEFDQTGEIEVDTESPPMKRVHVSNQMDILAELEGLRKQATMDSVAKPSSDRASDLDLDTLLTGAPQGTRELRQRIEKELNSDVFKKMRGVQLAIRIQDGDGETIHILDPVSVEVGTASSLEKLSVQLTLDLENLR